MHNWFAMETEAEFRRQEWARAVSNQKRATRLCAHGERTLLQRLATWTMPRIVRREIGPIAARGGQLAPQGTGSW